MTNSKMKHSIQIDGKEYELFENDARQKLYTKDGFTFYLHPICFGHGGSFGRAITQEGELPLMPPLSICKRMYVVPDLTDQYPDDVEVHFEAMVKAERKRCENERYPKHLQQCENEGKRPECHVLI